MRAETGPAFDAVDTHGNSRLFNAMDEARTPFAAEVTSVQNGSSAAAECLKGTGLPQCAPGDTLWQPEGWTTALCFRDAAVPCRELTRDCVEGYLERKRPYTAHGLLLPVTCGGTWSRRGAPHLSVRGALEGPGQTGHSEGETTRNCFNVPQPGCRPSSWTEGSWPPRTAGERPDDHWSSPLLLTMSHHFGNKVVIEPNLRRDKAVQPHGRRIGGTDREVT